ncbi:glutamyl-tRNA synthetase [Niveomyces insectorum RCEF 264]|uniref:glutamate--tRNA ligase n=1 Tax=Niveomyces insectorum RCEF 264 TaxID=1081102 RepID=A0A167RAY8_9HYPO|nr:glutamyl-tRNA synthetase [Niveomyces insectorum RCEF 264]
MSCAVLSPPVRSLTISAPILGPLDSTSPVPQHPAFRWHETAERFREKFHRPLAEDDTATSKNRRSIFLEMGLQDNESGNDRTMDGLLLTDELLKIAGLEATITAAVSDDEKKKNNNTLVSRKRQRPISGIPFAHFVKVTFDGGHDAGTGQGSTVHAENARKRLSWPLAAPAARSRVRLRRDTLPAPPRPSDVRLLPRAAVSTTQRPSPAATFSRTTTAPAALPDQKQQRWYSKLGREHDNMAKLDIAAKAEMALVLPSVVLASYVRRTGIRSDLTQTFHGAETISGTTSYAQLTFADGNTIADAAVSRYLADLVELNKGDSQVGTWVQKSDGFSSKNRRDLETALVQLDAYLTLRTYLVGYELTIGDLTVWTALRSNHVALSLIKKAAGNVLRWYNYIGASNPWLAETIEELTAPAAKERAKVRAAASAAGASYDIDLPDLTGPITTRFPPEPSGYLHIGHAKAALLNDYFARSRPGGKLICRFDDTNPTKESMEFQDSIVQDLDMIGIKPDTTSYSSDYFQQMHDLAIQLIKDGKAFADDSELGKGDEERKNRLPSKCRGLSIETTLEKFAEMKTGSEEGRRWCIRARIAYDSPNGTLRDPVIYRCNLTPHHRTGSSWHVYPTYDFCAPILDSIEGVTLALRTNEYRDRNVQYKWFQEALGLRSVPIYDFSRMNFIRTVLSKRKLTRIVEEGKVWGWDDPRMPTIRGVLRRGMTVSALREFVLKQGPSRNILNLEWGAFWALNKKHIDPVASRHTAILQEDAVQCTVRNVQDVQALVRPKYVKNLDLGTKTVVVGTTIVLDQADAQTFAVDEEITLMNWGNAFVRHITKSTDGEKVTALELDFFPDGDVKKTKKVTWLAVADGNQVAVDLVSFDHLITKDKLEKTDTLEDYLTPVTEFRKKAVADCNVKELKQGAIVQFERRGYFRLDTAFQDDKSSMVFFEIPTR